MATDAPTATGVSTAEKASWERIKEPAIYVRLISLVVVIGGWELMGQTGNIDPVTFSYPSAISVAFWELTVNGQMTAAAYESSQILVAGLLIAIPWASCWVFSWGASRFSNTPWTPTCSRSTPRRGRARVSR